MNEFQDEEDKIVKTELLRFYAERLVTNFLEDPMSLVINDRYMYDAIYATQLEFCNLNQTIQDLRQKCNRKLKQFEESWYQSESKRVDKINSFIGQDLCKPGTLIQLDNGSIHLVGTVINFGHIGDEINCDYIEDELGVESKIPKTAVVTKYCRIIEL